MFSIEEARKNTIEANVKPDLTEVLKNIVEKIDSEIEEYSKSGSNFVYMRYTDFEKFVEEEFPNLTWTCLKYAVETIVEFVKNAYSNSGYDIELSSNTEEINYNPLNAYRTSITIKW